MQNTFYQENEMEFEYILTKLLPEYTYVCTVAAITNTVENPGQDKRIQFITPSTSMHYVYSIIILHLYIINGIVITRV